MGSKYKHVDLIVAQTEFGRRLFEAPSFCGLSKGDKIKVNTRAGIVEATVTAVAYSEVWEGYMYNFIITACGATKPLKRVVSKTEIKDIPMDYTEVDSDEQAEESDQ